MCESQRGEPLLIYSDTIESWQDPAEELIGCIEPSIGYAFVFGCNEPFDRLFDNLFDVALQCCLRLVRNLTIGQCEH